VQRNSGFGFSLIVERAIFYRTSEVLIMTKKTRKNILFSAVFANTVLLSVSIACGTESTTRDSGVLAAEASVESGVQATEISEESGVQATEVSKESKVQATEISEGSEVQATEISEESEVQAAEISEESGVQATEISEGSGVQAAEISEESGVQATEISEGSGVQAAEISEESGVQATEISEESGVQAAETIMMVVSDDMDDEWHSAFFDKYVAGHLQIGTRFVFRKLTDDDSGHQGESYGSGTFLGTIYGLDDIQNYFPVYLYVQYLFNKYVGLELAYDQMEAETKAMGLYSGQSYSDLANGRVKTDGDVSLYGPTLSIVGRYPNSSSFTPFVGIGLGFFFAEFDSTSEWEYRSSGDHHVMNLDDQIALQLTAGTDWEFRKQWSLNASVQYTSVTVDAAFDSYDSSGAKTQSTQTGEFPLDNIAFRLGIAYSF
jgi:outer membrane protein W